MHEKLLSSIVHPLRLLKDRVLCPELLLEAIHGCACAALMIAPQKGDCMWQSQLPCCEKQQNLQPPRAPVYKVSYTQVM